ncbi:MAG: transcriptional regulator [Deltaproteobacteria bacterium]|nr:transcriptional regulator [Deltaproteobacteria bacterium]
MAEADLTIRQRIAAALKEGMLTSKDISRAVGIMEKEAIDHLGHVARTVNRAGGGERFVVEPSVCRSCGFVFRKRGRLKTPSRCPVCRSEEITEMRFGIVER